MQVVHTTRVLHPQTLLQEGLHGTQGWGQIRKRDSKEEREEGRGGKETERRESAKRERRERR